MATRLLEELEALSACVREFARFPRYTAISFISPLREEDAPLKYGSRPRNSLLSGFRCSSNPPPPARRTRLITRSDHVSNFFTGFSNCETPTRYQATTDSSNSVISRVKRSGAWRAIARCHARNVAPSVKRACKTVNHRADPTRPPVFRQTSSSPGIENPLMNPDPGTRFRETNEGRFVTDEL